MDAPAITASDTPVTVDPALAALVDRISGPALVVGGDGRVVYANGPAAASLGASWRGRALADGVGLLEADGSRFTLQPVDGGTWTIVLPLDSPGPGVPSEFDAERYALATAALNGAVYDYDIPSGRIRWSEGIKTVFGYDQTENGFGDWLTERVHPDDRESVKVQLRASQQGSDTFRVSYRFARADGTYAHVRDQAVNFRDGAGRVVRAVGAIVDITDQVTAEAARRETYDRLAAVADTFDGALYEWDMQSGEMLLMGGLVGGLRRVELEGVVSSYWAERVHPEDGPRVREATAAAIAGQVTEHTDEYRFRDPAGEWVSVWDRTHILRDEKGAAVRLVGTMVDISALRAAQERSRETETRYQALVEQIPAYVAATDSYSSVLYMSPKCAEIFGLDAVETTIPDIWYRMVHPDDRDRVLAEIARATRDKGRFLSQYRIVRKDGTQLWIQDQAVTVRDDLDRPVFMQGVMFDITEQKRQERALSEANQQLQEWVERLEQRGREIAMLSELGEVLQACLTETEAYGVLAPFAQQLFPGSMGALSITRSSRDRVEPVVAWGREGLPEAFTPDDCWALRRGRVHVVPDASRGMVCGHVRDDSPATYVCVPILAKGEALGTLYLAYCEPAPLAPETQQLAVTVAENVGLSMANLRLRETLRLQSIRDPLTGLFNRRYMEESLAREISRCSRNQRPLSVLMMDIDHFKRFNDSFGHAAGDALLKAFADFLRTNTRAEDIACRYGGEEITLIFPDTTMPDACARAEQIRGAIKQLHVESQGTTLGRVTVSIGVATFPGHGADGADLLRAADEALYRAKRAGRDRVLPAEEQAA
jgi:diguanylate cyclase (GGDEF)-like protein/PAS domain S-box-containing protein